MRVQSLDWEDPLEEGMATHSSILAWRIPWTEEPGGLQSIGSQRVGHNWSNLTYTQRNECCSSDLGRRRFVLEDHNALSFSAEMSSVKLQWQYYRCPRVVNKVVPPDASCCGCWLSEPLNSALPWYPARPLWAVCVLTLSWPLSGKDEALNF